MPLRKTTLTITTVSTMTLSKMVQSVIMPSDIKLSVTIMNVVRLLVVGQKAVTPDK